MLLNKIFDIGPKFVRMQSYQPAAKTEDWNNISFRSVASIMYSPASHALNCMKYPLKYQPIKLHESRAKKNNIIIILVVGTRLVSSNSLDNFCLVGPFKNNKSFVFKFPLLLFEMKMLISSTTLCPTKDSLSKFYNK